MAKIHKVSFYLIDCYDEYDYDDIECDLDRLFNGIDVLEIEESEEFEWNDNLDINKVWSSKKEFEEYFKED